MKFYKVFQNCIINFSLLFFVLISFGTISHLSDFGMYVNNISPQILMIAIVFLCIQLFLLIMGIFRYIDKTYTQKKKQYFIALFIFILMFLICFILFCNIHPKPNTDSFDCLDEAMYLYKYGKVTSDNYHIRLMSIYGNNYLLVLIYKWIFQFFMFSGLTNFLEPLYILNILLVLLSVFITWLIINDCFGIQKANKTLILCALNPLYYCIIFWLYSMTLSLPIMMGIIYISIKLYKSEKLVNNLLYSIILGLLVILGYEIRPTSVFPFIAIIIVGIVYIIKYKLFKKFFFVTMILILIIGFMKISINNEKNKYFGEISSNNYPIFFWTSMGSHGSGDLLTQQEDRKIADSFPSYKEKKHALKERTIVNYKKLGLIGTVNLWSDKIVKTWSDGYSSIDARMNHGSSESILYELISGNHRILFEIYCQSYRLLISVGIIIFCIYSLKNKVINNLDFIFLLSIFGGIVFYMIWEAKNIYSAPFLLLMFVIAEEGFSKFIYLNQTTYKFKKNNYFVLINYSLLIILVSMMIICISNLKTKNVYYRINTNINEKVNASINGFEDFILQDFYVKKSFNNIRLMASVDKTNDNISSYDITVFDSFYNELRKVTVDANDIHNNMISVKFDKINSDNHYYIKIQKNNLELGNIVFYTKNTYFLDSYKGNLIIDGNGNYTNDLNMDVIQTSHKEYFSFKYMCILIALYIIFSTLSFYMGLLYDNCCNLICSDKLVIKEE